MGFKYQSGEEIKKGDQILYHRAPGRIEFVTSEPEDPETEWYVQEAEPGIMICDAVGGLTFVPADQIVDDEDLEFVARGEMPADETK